ncbi:hypothetical protein SLEP1_g38871 [Rubroshorea leprosula]|uniref:Cyclin-dependent protein kinase inhibitor SMR3 n=1 Tax=Rubroshorea leprosula TaxID=152421 RepID=A0AAV5KYP7_9ROSI|nr:hypothetical protein SLEP1_g38871 [Rubroshorea leprosula]
MLNSELFLAREDEGNEFDLMKRPMLGFQKECNSAASEQEGEVEDEGKEEVRSIPVRTGRKNKEDTGTAVSEKSGNTGKLSLGEFEVTVGENDEGFRTPTSQDHRIPVVKECPPAPRKPKPPSRKRKASPNTGTRLQLLDLTEEVESLFPKPDFHRNNKKARREEN